LAAPLRPIQLVLAIIGIKTQLPYHVKADPLDCRIGAP
jgi:hypothetical protein